MGRVTAKHKRELEKEIKEIAVRLETIINETQESIWIESTRYSDGDIGTRVVRFFEGNGYEQPLVMRPLKDIKGILSVRPKKKEEQSDEI